MTTNRTPNFDNMTIDDVIAIGKVGPRFDMKAELKEIESSIKSATQKININEYGQIICPGCGENSLSLVFSTIMYQTGIFTCLHCKAKGEFDTKKETVILREAKTNV